MNRRQISKLASYLLLILLIIISWIFYQYQLSQVAADKQVTTDQLKQQQTQIAQLNQEIERLKQKSQFQDYQLANDNCTINSCLFYQQDKSNPQQTRYNGYLTITGHLAPQSAPQATNQTNQPIKITANRQQIPNSLIDKDTVKINTFFLDDQQRQQIQTSSSDQIITIAIVHINQINYAINVTTR